MNIAIEFKVGYKYQAFFEPKISMKLSFRILPLVSMVTLGEPGDG